MMSSNDEEVILKLVRSPWEPVPRITRAELLDHFQTRDGKALGLRLLNESVGERYADGVELSFIVAKQFGIDDDYFDQLTKLAYADWHHKHEDIATNLGKLRRPDTVDSLHHLAVWVPDYLDFDESRALARKAVRALQVTPGEEAVETLRELCTSPDTLVAGFAERALHRRIAADNES